MKASTRVLFPWMLASALATSQVIDWGAPQLDISIGSHTYKHIHHRSQKKLRRLNRQANK